MNNLLQGINVFLIGMMGTGKTTVGKVLAQELNYHFFDTDVLIEQVTKQTISQIFLTEGESVFREVESQVLGELCSYKKVAIATGGGIILKRENWSYLHQGLIIWLDVSVELLIERLAEDTTRPLLSETDLREKLTSLLEQRRSLYAQADIHIVIETDQSPEQIVTKIIETIPSKLKPKLEPPLSLTLNETENS